MLQAEKPEAEKPQVEKPKVEQPEAQLKIEQYQAEHQTMAKEGGATKALEGGSKEAQKGSSHNNNLQENPHIENFSVPEYKIAEVEYNTENLKDFSVSENNAKVQRDSIRSQTLHSKGTAYDITKYQTFLTKYGIVCHFKRTFVNSRGTAYHIL